MSHSPWRSGNWQPTPCGAIGVKSWPRSGWASTAFAAIYSKKTELLCLLRSALLTCAPMCVFTTCQRWSKYAMCPMHCTVASKRAGHLLTR